MRTFIICSDTNYDLMIHVVNAETREEAMQIAFTKQQLKGEDVPTAWEGCRIYEIDTWTKGLVFWD